jgi:hypothetical protein
VAARALGLARRRHSRPLLTQQTVHVFGEVNVEVSAQAAPDLAELRHLEIGAQDIGPCDP